MYSDSRVVQQYRFLFSMPHRHIITYHIHALDATHTVHTLQYIANAHIEKEKPQRVRHKHTERHRDGEKYTHKHIYMITFNQVSQILKVPYLPLKNVGRRARGKKGKMFVF